jgi:hypothetical protein
LSIVLSFTADIGRPSVARSWLLSFSCTPPVLPNSVKFQELTPFTDEYDLLGGFCGVLLNGHIFVFMPPFRDVDEAAWRAQIPGGP